MITATAGIKEYLLKLPWKNISLRKPQILFLKAHLTGLRISW